MYARRHDVCAVHQRAHSKRKRVSIFCITLNQKVAETFKFHSNIAATKVYQRKIKMFFVYIYKRRW